MKITCGSIFLSKTVLFGLFARRDAIRDNQFEFATVSDSETSYSDNENE